MKVSKCIFVSLLSLVILDANELQFGFGGLKFNYNEYSTNGTWLDSETNGDFDIDGGFIKYNFDLKPLEKYNQKIELWYRYHEGSTKYDGDVQSLGTKTLTSYTGTTLNYLIHGHARYKIYTPVKKDEVGLFVGIGHRYWDREIQGRYGLLERYTWNYGEVGINGLWYDKEFFTGFELSYQKAIEPKMKAYFNGGMKFDLGNVDGYKLKVPFGYEVNKNYKISLVYMQDIWNIEKSNVVN